MWEPKHWYKNIKHLTKVTWVVVFNGASVEEFNDFTKNLSGDSWYKDFNIILRTPAGSCFKNFSLKFGMTEIFLWNIRLCFSKIRSQLKSTYFMQFIVESISSVHFDVRPCSWRIILEVFHFGSNFDIRNQVPSRHFRIIVLTTCGQN